MNSFDMHTELLKAARAVTTVFDLYDNASSPNHIETPLDVSMRQLKAAIAVYDPPARGPAWQSDH